MIVDYSHWLFLNVANFIVAISIVEYPNRLVYPVEDSQKLWKSQLITIWVYQFCLQIHLISQS